MKESLAKIGRTFAVVGSNVLERFKREPAAVRLALMGLLGSLAIFDPAQLSAIETFIDRVTPALLILLAADLRGKVTPQDAPRKTVTVPVEVPQNLPSGPSGVF